jgi:hypothetical protein
MRSKKNNENTQTKNKTVKNAQNKTHTLKPYMAIKQLRMIFEKKLPKDNIFSI